GVKVLLMQGQISAGHGRALLGARDPLALARKVIAEGLSVRQVEALAARAIAAKEEERQGCGYPGAGARPCEVAGPEGRDRLWRAGRSVDDPLRHPRT